MFQYLHYGVKVEYRIVSTDEDVGIELFRVLTETDTRCSDKGILPRKHIV